MDQYNFHPTCRSLQLQPCVCVEYIVMPYLSYGFCFAAQNDVENCNFPEELICCVFIFMHGVYQMRDGMSSMLIPFCVILRFICILLFFCCWLSRQIWIWFPQPQFHLRFNHEFRKHSSNHGKRDEIMLTQFFGYFKSFFMEQAKTIGFFFSLLMILFFSRNLSISISMCHFVLYFGSFPMILSMVF